MQVGGGALMAVRMGALTATGGGVIRDVIRNELPLMLHREIYVSAALAGGAGLVVLRWLGVPDWAAVLGGAVLAFVLRGMAIALDLHLPVARVGTGGDDVRSAAWRDASGYWSGRSEG